MCLRSKCIYICKCRTASFRIIPASRFHTVSFFSANISAFSKAISDPLFEVARSFFALSERKINQFFGNLTSWRLLNLSSVIKKIVHIFVFSLRLIQFEPVEITNARKLNRIFWSYKLTFLNFQIRSCFLFIFFFFEFGIFEQYQSKYFNILR